VRADTCLTFAVRLVNKFQETKILSKLFIYLRLKRNLAGFFFGKIGKFEQIFTLCYPDQNLFNFLLLSSRVDNKNNDKHPTRFHFSLSISHDPPQK